MAFRPITITVINNLKDISLEFGHAHADHGARPHISSGTSTIGPNGGTCSVYAQGSIVAGPKGSFRFTFGNDYSQAFYFNYTHPYDLDLTSVEVTPPNGNTYTMSNENLQQHEGSCTITLQTAGIGNNRWMGALLEQGVNIGELSLRDLVIPGTHDSATFSFHTPFIKELAQCQALDIGNQLELGIRFLDIRLKRVGDDYMAHHGVAKDPTTIESMMQDINNFFTNTAHSKEVLILRVSHLSGIESKDQEDDLLTHITHLNGQVNPRFAARPQPRSVASATSLTINDLLNNNKNIVAIYQPQQYSNEEIEANYPVWCNDNDSDANRVLTMDQVWKDTNELSELLHALKQHQIEQADQPSLFMLQTVLTPIPGSDVKSIESLIKESKADIEKGVIPSVWELSKENNAKLLEWIDTDAIKRRLNIIFMNFVGQNFSQWNSKNLIDVVIDINKRKAKS